VKKHLLSLIFVLMLALQMSAQSLLKDGKIPKDLVITLSLGGTVQYANYYSYKITSDGKIVYTEELNGLPIASNYGLLLKQLKTPELKENLSKKQIKSILKGFESAGFFEMNEYYQGYSDKVGGEVTCVNHAMSKSLSISINNVNKKVGFFLGCSYSENSPLKKFLVLYDKILGHLKNVKKRKIENQ
jgi:hypothetical protein